MSRPCGCGARGRHRASCPTLALDKPRGASAQIADMAGVAPEYAALFERKPRAHKAAPSAPSTSATPAIAWEEPLDVRAELERSLDRVGELEQELRAARAGWSSTGLIAEIATRELDQLRGEAVRAFRARSAARLRPHLAVAAAPPRRARQWARGGSRVRDLRQELRLTRKMLARQQAARGLSVSKLSLIGGREQLLQRLGELPRYGNPYAALPNDKGGRS